MSFRELRNQVEGIGDFPPIFEDIDSARGHHLVRELRFAPADIERSDDVIKEVSGDTARIVPVFAETEEALGAEWTLGSATQPHLPIDEIVPFAFRPGVRINRV